MNAVILKKKKDLSPAGPFRKRKGTLTLYLKHPLPTFLCVCACHVCMPDLTSISGSLWEENGFHTGVCESQWVLGGGCCPLCRHMRRGAEPEWMGQGAAEGDGRGDRRTEIRALCTFFKKKIPIMLQRGLIYASFQFITCFVSFSCHLKKDYAIQKIHRDAIFSSEHSAASHACFVVGNRVSSQQFLALLQVQPPDTGGSGNREEALVE